jgi:HSP20 family molecular chaperone IbpA
MPLIPVQKVSEPENNTLPIFTEIKKRLAEVQQRAFQLFQERGEALGRELDDWLTAERHIFGWAKAELAEKDNAYEIQVALPGFDPKDLEVTATPEEIIVRAASEQNRREETPTPSAAKDNDLRVVWSEFGSREVCRRFVLPKPVMVDKVAARLEKGILHIDAPYVTQAIPVASPKQIHVAAA